MGVGFCWKSGVGEVKLTRVEHRAGSDGFGPIVVISDETDHCNLRPNFDRLKAQLGRVSG